MRLFTRRSARISNASPWKPDTFMQKIRDICPSLVMPAKFIVISTSIIAVTQAFNCGCDKDAVKFVSREVRTDKDAFYGALRMRLDGKPAKDARGDYTVTIVFHDKNTGQHIITLTLKGSKEKSFIYNGKEYFVTFGTVTVDGNGAIISIGSRKVSGGGNPVAPI